MLVVSSGWNLCFLSWFSSTGVYSDFIYYRVLCMYSHSKYELCKNNSQLHRYLYLHSKYKCVVVLIIVDIYDCLAMWGGIVGIYSSGGKSRQKVWILPNGDYYVNAVDCDISLHVICIMWSVLWELYPMH